MGACMCGPFRLLHQRLIVLNDKKNLTARLTICFLVLFFFKVCIHLKHFFACSEITLVNQNTHPPKYFLKRHLKLLCSFECFVHLSSRSQDGWLLFKATVVWNLAWPCQGSLRWWLIAIELPVLKTNITELLAVITVILVG